MLQTDWTNEASLHPKSIFIFFWKNFSYLKIRTSQRMHRRHTANRRNQRITFREIVEWVSPVGNRAQVARTRFAAAKSVEKSRRPKVWVERRKADLMDDGNQHL
jgi:hypothetical protein